MLVLQRQYREGIMITHRRTGETIRVKVVKTGNRVELGIEASDDYIILRSELAEDLPSQPKESAA